MSSRIIVQVCIYAAVAIWGVNARLFAEVTDREKREYQEALEREKSQGPEIDDEVFQCIPRDWTYRPEWVFPAHRQRDEVVIRIVRDGKTVYSWDGHVHSTFDIEGDELAYAQYSESSPGCTLVAVDLKTGKIKWRNVLKTEPAESTPGYKNRVRVRSDGDDFRVFREETGGRYIEAVDIETGQTLAHRTMPQLCRSPVISGSTAIDAKAVLGTPDGWSGNNVIIARVVSIKKLAPGAERLTSHTAVLEPLMTITGGADCSERRRIEVRMWVDAKTSSIEQPPAVGAKIMAVLTHGYISGDEEHECFWVGPDKYAFMPHSSALVEVTAANDKVIAETVASIHKAVSMDADGSATK